MGEREREKGVRRQGRVVLSALSLSLLSLSLSPSLSLSVSLSYFLCTSNSRGISAKQFFPVIRSVSVVVSRKARKYPRVGKAVPPSVYFFLLLLLLLRLRPVHCRRSKMVKWYFLEKPPFVLFNRFQSPSYISP